MKRICFLFLLLVSWVIAQGQDVRAKRIIADENLMPPVRDTVAAPGRVGELRFRVADNSFYGAVSMTAGVKRWEKLPFLGSAPSGSVDQRWIPGRNKNNYDLSIDLGLTYRDENKQTVTLANAESLIHHFVFVRDTLFAITRSVPNVLIRFNNPNDLSDYDTVKFTGYGDCGGGMSLVYSETTGKLYTALMPNACSSNEIIEISPSGSMPWTVKNSRGTTGWTYQALAIDTGSLYTVVADDNMRDTVIKFSLADWTSTAAHVTGNSTSGYIHGMKHDGTNLYLTEFAINPGKIYKVRPSDLSTLLSASFASGDENPTDDPETVGEYVWVGLETSSGYVLKIKKSDFSITRVNTGTPSVSYGLRQVGNYLWNMHATSPGVITRIDPETGEIYKHTLTSGENNPNEITTDGQRLFLSLYTTPSKVVRLTAPTLTYVTGGGFSESDPFSFHISDTASKTWDWADITGEPTFITTRDRLGFSGEDVSASANRSFSLDGFDLNITNTATSMLLEIEPKEFEYYAEDPATTSFRSVNLSARAAFKTIYGQINGNEKTALFQIDSTTGVTLYTFNSSTLHQSHIKVRADSMEIHPYDGIINMDSLKQSTNMDNKWVVVWDKARQRLERIDPDSVGGTSGGSNFANTNLTFTGNRTHDMDGNTLIIANGEIGLSTNNDFTAMAGSPGGNSGTFNATPTTVQMEVATGGMARTYVAGFQDSVTLHAYSGLPLNKFGRIKIQPDSIKIMPDEGNLFIDTLTKAPGTYALRWDPATQKVTYEDTTMGGGITGFTDGSGFDGTVTGSNLSLKTSLTQGSVAFIGASGALGQNNSNFFWDETNNRLGIGTSSPSQQITVIGNTDANALGPIHVQSVGTSITGTALSIDGRSETGGNVFSFLSTGANSTPQAGHFAFYTPARGYIALFQSNGNVIIGNANPTPASDLGSMLEVHGDGIFTLGLTVNESGADSDTRFESDTHTDAFLLDGTDGSTTLGAYGGGTITGTMTYGLGVNSSGKIIETPGTAEGSFTGPTLTNTTNIAASTFAGGYYYRVGNKVHVFGRVQIDATATGAVELRMTLPISTGSFTNDYDAAGVVTNGDTGVSGDIRAVAGTGSVALVFVATTTSNDEYAFHFTYNVTPP